MQDVINKLRESRDRHDLLAKESGIHAGKSWAKRNEGAEAIELQRLAEARDKSVQDWDTAFLGGESAYTSFERFYFLIRPEDDGDRAEAAEFFSMYPPHVITDPFVQGFAEGALEIWDAVKDQL